MNLLIMALMNFLTNDFNNFNDVKFPASMLVPQKRLELQRKKTDFLLAVYIDNFWGVIKLAKSCVNAV